MAYTCETYLQPALPTLAIRAQAAVDELPEALQKSYARIFSHLSGLGEQPAGSPFVAYYNADMQNLDIEAGTVVARPLPDAENIRAGTLPNCLVASCTFTGPYEQLGAAYAELARWVEQRGYHPSGVVYEFYLNDPAHTPPARLQTQVMFLLKDEQ